MNNAGNTGARTRSNATATITTSQGGRPARLARRECSLNGSSNAVNAAVVVGGAEGNLRNPLGARKNCAPTASCRAEPSGLGQRPASFLVVSGWLAALRCRQRQRVARSVVCGTVELACSLASYLADRPPVTVCVCVLSIRPIKRKQQQQQRRRQQH